MFYFVGPIFHHSFLPFRRKNWAKDRKQYSFMTTGDRGTAGLEFNIFGFPRNSTFLEYVINCLHDNFPHEKATLFKTGPYFLKEAFLQYPYNKKINLISHEFVTSDVIGPDVIVFEDPTDSMWDDKEDVRQITNLSVTLPQQQLSR